MIEVIVELGEFLVIVLVIEHKFWVGEFAGVRKYFDIFFAFGEDEEGDWNIVGEHGLNKAIEE